MIQNALTLLHCSLKKLRNVSRKLIVNTPYWVVNMPYWPSVFGQNGWILAEFAFAFLCRVPKKCEKKKEEATLQPFWPNRLGQGRISHQETRAGKESKPCLAQQNHEAFILSLFWLSSAAFWVSIADAVQKLLSKYQVNFSRTRDHSGQSRACKMSPSCLLGKPIKTQDSIHITYGCCQRYNNMQSCHGKNLGVRQLVKRTNDEGKEKVWTPWITPVSAIDWYPLASKEAFFAGRCRFS